MIKKQKNNVSSIELADCEKTLREIYNISDSQPLYILKVDYFEKGSLIPIIGYEAFHPTNKSKLDLSHCVNNNNNINLNIPVTIDENKYFQHDPKNDFYTDICNAYTENGTDILLTDRQNVFNDNKMSL